MSTFKFSAVVDFEITPEEAASLLVENDGLATVPMWLHQHTPVLENHGAYNAAQLKESLGKILAQQKIDERRQLTMQT